MEADPSHQTIRSHTPKHTKLSVSKIIAPFLSGGSGPSNPNIFFGSTVLRDQLPHFSPLFAYWFHLFTFSSRKSCHKSSSHLNLGLGVFIVTFWLSLTCFLNHFCRIHSDYMPQTPQPSTKRLIRLPNASIVSQMRHSSAKRLNRLPNASIVYQTPQSSTSASIVYQTPQSSTSASFVSQTPQSSVSQTPQPSTSASNVSQTL
jgi:hypothetical protein